MKLYAVSNKLACLGMALSCCGLFFMPVVYLCFGKSFTIVLCISMILAFIASAITYGLTGVILEALEGDQAL